MSNPEYREKERLRAVQKNVALRQLVVDQYRGRCACCGETELTFLDIDHIEGNGNRHRREVVGAHLYAWLKRHRFPEGFQVLCRNCNWGKRMHGRCPHQIQVEELISA